MRCYMLRETGTHAYRGNVLNIEQNIEAMVESVTCIPHSLKDLPVYMCVRRQQKVPGEYKDFQVRRQVVAMWVKFLIKNNPYYMDLQQNDNVLNSLPENGNVADQLNRFDLAEPSEASSDDSDEEDFGPEDQQGLGPEQGGASGAPADENQVEETYLARPIDPKQSQKEQVEEFVRQFVEQQGTNADAIAQDSQSCEPQPWPAAGKVLSDYDTPGIQAMAFPTLFPLGKGDVTQKTRRVEVSLTESNQHLLKYCYYDQNRGKYVYPFAEHERWCFWAQNTAERHRANTQKSVYLHQTDEHANLTEDELQEIVNEGGDRLKEILGRMNAYNANINGSNAYLYQRRKELEALMFQKGLCTIWFSLSQADNHWVNLHKVLSPEADDMEFEDEEEKAKYQRKAARGNPHVCQSILLQESPSLVGDLLW